MKAIAICMLSMLGGALGAHPFDDRVDMITELYLVRDSVTKAEGMHLKVMYWYDGFFTSYTELQALDTDKNGYVTRAERDERFKTLATDLQKTLHLKVRGEQTAISPNYDEFEFVDLRNPDNDVSQPGGMDIKEARVGYTFDFDVTLATQWGEGSHAVDMTLADARIFIAVPDEQMRVFDDRGEFRKAVIARTFTKTDDKFQSMRFLWTIRAGAATTPPPGPTDSTPGPQEAAQPAQSDRERLIDEADRRRDSASMEARIEQAAAALRDGNAGVAVWFTLLTLMFVWGAAHAVMPGHGKTLVASYLIGTHGTKTDALFLGLVVTLAHTSGVLLLMGGSWAASEFWPHLFKNPEKELAEWIAVAVGATILLMGIGLVLKRTGGAHHEHDIFGRHVHEHDGHTHEHTHDSAEDSDILEEVPHTHSHHGHSHRHDHRHSHDVDPSKMTRMEVLRLGILGGIIPCPSAFFIGAFAIRQQWYLFGLIMVIVFSVGLAVVLSAIGLVLVQGKSYLAKRRKESKSRLLRTLEAKLPVFGGVLIALIGLAMLILALIRLDLIDPRTFTV